MSETAQPASFACLSDQQRKEAMARFAVLQPHLEHDVPLSRAAHNAGIATRTAERWLSRYRADGLAGLARPVRSDAGNRKLSVDFASLIEGLALHKPRPSVAAIYRQTVKIAEEKSVAAPSYATVHAIVRALDPALTTLAHEGSAAFRNRYELIHRHRAEAPNALWQADHTMLDILIVDADGKHARPWLSIILDDYSRAVAGYMVFSGRAFRAAYLSGVAPSDLAQAKSVMARLRHSRRAVCRSWQRLHEHPSRTSRGGAANRNYPFDRWQAARTRQDRTLLRHDQHRASAPIGRASDKGKTCERPRLVACRNSMRRSPLSLSASTTRARTVRPTKRHMRHGAAKAGCRACPTVWTTSIFFC